MRSREEVRQEYNELFKQIPDKWGNTDRATFMINALKEFVPNPATAIDVGCGNGVALERYATYSPETQLYGIDPSDEGIRLAHERVPNGIFTTAQEFEEIKKFDLIFCLGVAEHVEDLLPFLKDLKQKVSEGGYCYIEVPHNLLYSRGPKTFRRLTSRSRQYEWHFPRNEWELYLKRAGFKLVKRLKGLRSSWEFIWILQ